MERFIVGTGRCGSTLLSRMLGCNRKVLSISEFWSVFDRDAVFKEGVFSGDEVVELVTRNNLLNDFVASRNPFIDADTGHAVRKEAGTYALQAQRFPALKIFVNSYAVDDPDIYQDAVEFFSSQPRQALADHWRGFFQWLAARMDRRVWLERSGVSIEHVGKLIDWYPHAKLVHIHRDGPTNALGIRAFRHFVLYASFFLDPPGADELERALTCEVGSEDDPIMQRMVHEIPSLADFGRYWSWQIARGSRELMRLPPEQRLEVRYEELVNDPHIVLEQLAEFLELPEDDGWIQRATGELDPEGVPDRLSTLDSDSRVELEQACLPGQVLLGRVTGNPYEETMIRARQVADRVLEEGG